MRGHPARRASSLAARTASSRRARPSVWRACRIALRAA